MRITNVERDFIDYKNRKKWFSTGISYFHDDEIRTTYFRTKTVEDAIKLFRERTDDEILSVWLFDAEDVEEC